MYPTLRFKLDPMSSWDDELVAELAATGAIDSVDLKGQYEGTVVDQPPDPALYRRVIEALPDAWIEDPAVTDDTRPILEPHAARITWDAPIHSVEDIESVPWPPRTINIKPSRFGSVQPPVRRVRLLRGEGHRAVRRRAVGARPRPWPDPVPRVALPPRRGRTTSLPAATTPASRSPGCPTSPLEPAPALTGFRWAG